MCGEFWSLFQIKKLELRNPGYAQIPNIIFLPKKRCASKIRNRPPLTKNYLFLNRRCRCSQLSKQEKAAKDLLLGSWCLMRQVHAKTHCSKGCAAVQFTPQGLCNMLEHSSCPKDTGERQRLGKEVAGNADLHCFRLKARPRIIMLKNAGAVRPPKQNMLFLSFPEVAVEISRF